jgi:hypothetical protein
MVKLWMLDIDFVSRRITQFRYIDLASYDIVYTSKVTQPVYAQLQEQSSWVIWYMEGIAC